MCTKRYTLQLKDIKTIFYQELEALYPKTEVDAFFYRLIEHYLGVERFVLVLHPNYTVTREEEQPFFEALAQLKRERPLQYILGVAYFMDLKLKVDERVLIPRPETEELVQWIIEDIRNETLNNSCLNAKPIRLLDIGTGSGCMAIALAKKLPEAKVYALDVSEKALEVARENAAWHGVDVTFLHGDLLHPKLELDLEFDYVVSNPPYVREQEKAAIKNNVKQYEPAIALFVPDDNPLIYYKALATLARQYLTQNGTLYLEINQYLAKATQALLEAHNFSEIECRKDRFGNERMLKSKIKSL